MAAKKAKTKPALRPLRASDLERLIAIDEAHTGHARRRFFEKRLAAAAGRSGDFIHIGIDSGGKLAGFLLARIQQGEFGRDQPVVALDVIDVDTRAQGRGHGRMLLEGLTAAMRERGVSRLHSQAAWNNQPLLKFFGAAGFELAPRLVLERPVAEPLAESVDEV